MKSIQFHFTLKCLVVEGDFSVQLKSKSSWVGAVCQGNDIMIKIFHTREGLILHEKLCKQYLYIIGYVRHNRGAGRWEEEGVINGSRLLTVYGNMNAYLILELIPERYLSQSHSASNSKTYLIFSD